MLMPLRFAEKGLQRSRDTDPSAAKPATVKRHNESAPPVTTASAMPARSRRAAEAIALALDEHAVEITWLGPRTPSSRARNAAGVPISCWV